MKLHRPLLVAAVLAGAAGAAIADDITHAPEIDRFVSTASRAEVSAAAVAARSGPGPRNDYDRQNRSHGEFVAAKTRAQVVAETAEAQRLGLTAHGEAGVPQATPEQQERIRLAGLGATAGRGATRG